MVDYLDDKFKDRSDLTFYFKMIDCAILDEEWASVKLKDFEIIDGSLSFQDLCINSQSSDMNIYLSVIQMRVWYIG